MNTSATHNVVVTMYVDYSPSMYLDTTTRLVSSDLDTLRTYDGVRYASVHRDFTIHLEFDKTTDYGYTTLAAMCLREVLRLINTTVEQANIRLRCDNLNTDKKQRRLAEVLRLIKELPNPIAPFAATASDIRTGVELMVVDYQSGTIELIVPTETPHCCEGGGMGVYAGDDHYFLDSLSVVPKWDGTWNDRRLTIVNTAENRRKLVRLLERNHTSTARRIVQKYLEAFVDITVEQGRLVAALHI